MADKLPTIDISGAELNPRNFAQITDSYVRPETPAPSNLWEVAQALGGLSGDLKSWAGKKQAKQADDDLIRGQAQFLKDNRIGYGEGVKRGLIPAWASPTFQEGYKRAEGDYIGQNFGRDLDLAYSQWAGKDTATPAQFDEWAQSFTQQALKTNDPAVLRGMLPLLNQQLEAKRAAHTDFIAKKSYETGVTSHIAAATAAIETFEEDGLKRPEGTDYEGIWTDILARRKAASEAGVRGDDFDKEMVDSILSTAIKNHDGNLLDLFNKNLPGSETAIKDDPRFRDKLAGSEDKLLQIAAQQQEAAQKAQDRKDKEDLKQITGATITEISKNPTAPIPEEILAAGTKLDPEFRTKMLGAQKSLAEGGPEDADQITRLQQKLLDGGGQADVLDALHSGIIRKSETFTKMLEFSKGHEAPILQHDTAKQILKMIQSKTATAGDLGDPFGLKGLTDSGMAATLDFQKSALDWAQHNPNATYADQMKFLSEQGKHILDNIQGGATSDSSNITYTPDKPASNAFVKKTDAPDYAATRKMIDEANVKRDPALVRQDQQLNDVRPPVPAPSVDTLSPATRKNLETEAKKYGLDPAVIWERKWLKLDPTTRSLFNNATQPKVAPSNQQGSLETKPGDLSLSTIRNFESFIPKAKWDVNHWRVGYGSDTITKADGTVETVTKDTVITKADAERDLQRRVALYEKGITSVIGNRAWGQMPEGTKAALLSIVHNYGEVPGRIMSAVRSGNPSEIAQAILKLQGDNNGINSGRRKKEAQLAGLE